jgi:hypothetical protein
MSDNVRIVHTPLGARATVDLNGFQLAKQYPTMEAAAREARYLGLISAVQQSFLEEKGMAVPLGLSTYADLISFPRLAESGFKLGF